MTMTAQKIAVGQPKPREPRSAWQEEVERARGAVGAAQGLAGAAGTEDHVAEALEGLTHGVSQSRLTQ